MTTELTTMAHDLLAEVEKLQGTVRKENRALIDNLNGAKLAFNDEMERIQKERRKLDTATTRACEKFSNALMEATVALSGVTQQIGGETPPDNVAVLEDKKKASA